ncbi:hypothetical protein Tco_0831819, partial [Tanacetum coccineum]
VPVPLPDDPYEAIRRAYLDGTDTESEPFRDPIETETLETARMVVRVPPAMSPDLSISMAEVAAMFDSAFHKRFRSSYENSPSLSPPDLPLWKHYQDSDSVSEDAEDEVPNVEDKDPAAGDEGLVARDEGPGIGVESRGSDDESRGLDDEGHSVESDGIGLGKEEEVVLEGQHRVVPVVGAAVSVPLGLGYGALRHRELALEED